MLLVGAVIVWYMSNRKPQGRPVSLRVPSELDDRLTHVAAMNGRTRSEEVRAALELHALEVMRAYLDSRAGALELGDELEATKAHVAREIERWRFINYIAPRGIGHAAARSYVPN